MNSSITKTGQLELTTQEIEYLQNYLNHHDRGGYYMALYNMTGNIQALQQAQIATFSEGAGGAAYLANYLLDKFTDDYPNGGVFDLSQLVAEFSFNKIKSKIEENENNTGYIDENEMLIIGVRVKLNLL